MPTDEFQSFAPILDTLSALIRRGAAPVILAALLLAHSLTAAAGDYVTVVTVDSRTSGTQTRLIRTTADKCPEHLRIISRHFGKRYENWIVAAKCAPFVEYEDYFKGKLKKRPYVQREGSEVVIIQSILPRVLPPKGFASAICMAAAYLVRLQGAVGRCVTPWEPDEAASLIRGNATALTATTMAIGKRRIRLWGIDTPAPDTERGEAAKAALDSIIRDRIVTCFAFGATVDGRAIALCYAGDFDVAWDLVSEGYARDRLEETGGYYSFPGRWTQAGR